MTMKKVKIRIFAVSYSKYHNLYLFYKVINVISFAHFLIKCRNILWCSGFKTLICFLRNNNIASRKTISYQTVVIDKMSTDDNSEVGPNAIINQIDIQDVRNIIVSHGSLELINKFEELVNNYENPNPNCKLTSENGKVVSEVS